MGILYKTVDGNYILILNFDNIKIVKIFQEVYTDVEKVNKTPDNKDTFNIVFKLIDF